MASCRRCGAIPVDGRKRSSAASTRAWTLAIQAVNSFVVVGTGEVFQRVFFEHLHLLLRAGEDPLAQYCQGVLARAQQQGKVLEENTLKNFPGADDDE